MYAYNPSQVWNQSVWRLLGIAGGVVFSLFLVGWIRDIAGYIRSKPWRNPDVAGRQHLCRCALAGMTVAIVVVATPFLFDRYGLGVLPMLMIPALRRMSNIGVDPRQKSESGRSISTGESAIAKTWELGLALGGALAYRRLLTGGDPRLQGARHCALAGCGKPHRQGDKGESNRSGQ